MAALYDVQWDGKSLPSRGAWIEIMQPANLGLWLSGRSPRGERGLKYENAVEHGWWDESLPSRGAWIEICPDSQIWAYRVAPLAGSVD